MTSIVHVEVSGLTGSGKSAVMGEIEIALKALGLKVEYGPDFQAEKNGTHADWQTALDLYQPTVVLSERNISRQPPAREDALPVALTVWYGEMPESNGRRNWTATLRRVNPMDKWDQGFCFARSEYPDRVRYEADRMRWIIGELPEEPDILAYDADAHSGYVAPHPAPDALRVAVEALEPFARAADGLDGLWSEDDWRWNDSVRSGVTVRDIRHARQALAALQAEQKGGA